MEIKRVAENERIGEFINAEFSDYAPDFYKKLGYKLEFVRKDKDPKLSKYFYLKKINFSSVINERETDIQLLPITRKRDG